LKLLVYADNHFCEKCSIINGYGTQYTLRLENQIASLNWVENYAIDRGCDAIVCLGDFFDKSQLTDQELTALRDIKWSNLPHYFIVGNHESDHNTLQYSSTKALEISDKYSIISTPTEIKFDDVVLRFLPYIIESDRKQLTEYFEKKDSNNKTILFSHNDLRGIQMGPIMSRTGFNPDEFQEVCDLCLNGHLHNGIKINDCIYNLGNLTGRDFGEDAVRYKHNVAFIDTNALASMEFIENPVAFNFYKLDLFDARSLNILTELKDNAVLSIRCDKSLLAQLREDIKNLGSKVVEFRLIATQDSASISSGKTPDISSLTVDHHTKFAECCKEKLGVTPVLEAELAEILK